MASLEDKLKGKRRLNKEQKAAHAAATKAEAKAAAATGKGVKAAQAKATAARAKATALGVPAPKGTPAAPKTAPAAATPPKKPGSGIAISLKPKPIKKVGEAGKDVAAKTAGKKKKKANHDVPKGGTITVFKPNHPDADKNGFVTGTKTYVDHHHKFPKNLEGGQEFPKGASQK